MTVRRSRRRSSHADPLAPIAPLWHRWSPSKLGVYVTCPLKFYYRYVLRLKTPATLDQILGTGLHRMFNSFFNKNYRDEKSFLGAWSYLWWQTLLREEYAGKISAYNDAQLPGKLYGKGRKILRTFWRSNLEFKTGPLKPLTEKHVAWNFGPYRLVAVVDRFQPVLGQGKRQRVIDYKTGFRRESKSELVRNVQLTIYQLAHRQLFGVDPLSLELHYPSYEAEKSRDSQDSLDKLWPLLSPELMTEPDPWPWEIRRVPPRTEQEIQVLISILNQASTRIQAIVTGSVSALEQFLCLPPEQRDNKKFLQSLNEDKFAPRPGSHCRYCDFEKRCRAWNPNEVLTPEDHWRAIVKSVKPKPGDNSQQLEFDLSKKLPPLRRKKSAAKSKNPPQAESLKS